MQTSRGRRLEVGLHGHHVRLLGREGLKSSVAGNWSATVSAPAGERISYFCESRARAHACDLSEGGEYRLGCNSPSGCNARMAQSITEAECLARARAKSSSCPPLARVLRPRVPSCRGWQQLRIGDGPGGNKRRGAAGSVPESLLPIPDALHIRRAIDRRQQPHLAPDPPCRH